MYTKENLHKMLDEIIDPELGVGIYTLGLIYNTVIHFKDKDSEQPESTDVVMTFTSPFCPYADALLERVESIVTLGGFGTPRIVITFDPPWQVPEHLRSMMGI